jgi:hypothetical protein
MTLAMTSGTSPQAQRFRHSLADKQTRTPSAFTMSYQSLDEVAGKREAD